MDTKKITINNEEIEIYTTIDDEAIEDNRDLLTNEELTDDTIDITEMIEKINNGDFNE